MVAPDDPTTRRAEPVPARSEGTPPAFVLAGPIDRDDIPVLCDRFQAALQAGDTANPWPPPRATTLGASPEPSTRRVIAATLGQRHR